MFFHDKSPDAYLRNPQATKRWLAELPSGSIGDSTRLLREAIEELNKITDLMPKKRLDILETMQPALANVLENLGRYYDNIVFPLSPKTESVIRMTESFLIDISRAYGLALSDDNGQLSRQAAAQVIYRVIEYTSLYFIRMVQVYGEARPGIWKQFYQMYLHADTLNIQNVKPFKDSDSIASIYKKTLLVFLLNPYGLHASQVEELYQIAKTWSTYTDLSSQAPKNPGEVVLSLEMQSDDPPQQTNNEHGRSIYYFLLTPLIQHLEKLRFDNAGSQQQLTDPSKETEKKLNINELTVRAISYLTLAVKRRSRRDKIDGVNAMVALGLEHIFYGLQDLQQHQVYAGRIEDVDNKEIPRRKDEFGFSEDTQVNEAYQIANEKKYQAENIKAFMDIARYAEKHFQQWDVLNISQNGCLLRWSNPEVIDARIGKPTALKFNQKDSKWRMGVIRRMQFVRNRLEIGIEYIGDRMIPVTLRRPHEHALTLGIFMMSDGQLNLPERIVIPTYIFKIGEVIEVNFNYKKEQVELSRIISYTATYTIFRFKIILSQLQTSQDTEEKKPVDNQTDQDGKNIRHWGSL
jgi:hypothetical protein